MTESTIALLDRFYGCLSGLAVGDAVGTAVEFCPRGSFEPITEMEGGGPFHLKAGEWTDDTSMALCLAASLVERGGFDARDQMERYLKWAEHGYMSSNGRCFDIGNTVRRALDRFRRTLDPFSGAGDPDTAGNGSIMRLAPAVLFYHPDLQAVRHFAAESSRTTHAAPECLDACRLFGEILSRALGGASKEDCLFGGAFTYHLSPAVEAIARGDYRDKTADDIRGTGYVVASLEAALWCFWTASNFEEAILRATNLGDDADTTAAVCGQIAGAFWGKDGIPPRWLKKLVMGDEILKVAERLFQNRIAEEKPKIGFK